MTEQSDMARRPMVNLDGRTAIITGSGKGIGAAVAKCLASHGAAVVINYVHDAASAQRTVEDIHSLGGLAIAVQADVCDESQSSKLVGTAVDSFGGVDILVNNASDASPLTRVAVPLLLEAIGMSLAHRSRDACMVHI